jgi:membrane-bound ClpP family serine protease
MVETICLMRKVHRLSFSGWLLGAALVLLLPAGGRADEAASEGIIVQVPPVITTESTNRLRSLLHGPLKHFEARSGQGGSFKVLCDFNPDNRRSECEDFPACLGLATYLRSLGKDIKGVTVVAFVHGKVSRHSVLPVLACNEIVMSTNPEAYLGRVTTPGKSLGKLERTAYEEITRNRFPFVLVRKMFEPDLEVIRTEDGYRDANEKPRPRGTLVDELPRGVVANYTFAQASKFGLCQQKDHNTIEDVRLAYGLPRDSIHGTLDRTLCWRIPVQGVINGELKEKLERRIGRALRARATLLILELECGDGESEKAYEIGLYLTTLKDKRADLPLRTIAYVTNKARNTAAFLAFGCDKIIMQKEIRDGESILQEGALLGDFERYIQGHPSLESQRKELEQLSNRPDANPERRRELELRLRDGMQFLEKTLRERLVDVASKQHYDPVLVAGMFSREMRIHSVVSIRGKSERRFLTQEEFDADQKQPKPHWRSIGLVKPATDKDKMVYLTLTAERARDLGVASATVKDFEGEGGLCEFEGINPTQVHTAKSDWMDGLADFLRDPWTSVILVMLGITCLIMEMKMPGVGLPGVIAAICFVLFFWSHSQLHGQITWLAVLLFVLGLLLLGLEIFVLPGFGVSGLSGILLILASLGLVVYGHWPRSNQEWITFGHKISPFGISMIGALVGAFLLARYLPHIPYANRLLLKPQDEAGEAVEAVPVHPAHAELAALLGAIGVAATPLRPAGKTQFGDTFVDVVAEGGYIMPGTRVQVIEVEGNRVVVKEV